MDIATPDANASAVREALDIEELLHGVLLFTDKASKASSVRVCRRWFNIAIKFLWEDIQLLHAMQLLAPISKKEDNEEGTYVSLFSLAQTMSHLTRREFFQRLSPVHLVSEIGIGSPYTQIMSSTLNVAIEQETPWRRWHYHALLSLYFPPSEKSPGMHPMLDP